MLSKKHQRSSTVQEERVANEGRHNLHKQAHDKKSNAEPLHVYINRARLTACKVGILSREILQLLKICPTPLFEVILTFIAHGHIFERSMINSVYYEVLESQHSILEELKLLNFNDLQVFQDSFFLLHTIFSTNSEQPCCLRKATLH